jgi:hypothetical protein
MKPSPVVRGTLSRDVRGTLSRDVRSTLSRVVRGTLSRDDPPASYGTVLYPQLDSQ